MALSFFLSRASRYLPKISQTERIALSAGDTSLDRDIFSGSVNLRSLPQRFPLPPVDNLAPAKKLLSEINSYEVDKRGYLNNEELNRIRDSGLLGMIIPKKYGGLEYSHSQHSAVVTYLGSYSSPLAVSVMVPNSLGPAELLLHYGTEDQKNYFLPKLAKGEMIPCFGLTTAWSGSDAANMPCRGEFISKNKILLNLNKRYITLAPIADLIGVAFILDDDSGKRGISLALLERKKFPQLDTSNRHDVGSAFWNGTIRAQNLEIDLSDVIGGEEGLGQGWKMLMECLAAGRGISLPAGAIGSSKFLLSYTLHYAQYREQFKTPLLQMEGVQLKLSSMILDTLTATAGQQLFNAILDSGAKPSVLSGILKYKTTEYGRNVVNNAMDVLAGVGICRGPNNPIAQFYQAMPISINVEGNNVLTRNLIIFGNGLLKSHPHLYPLVLAVENSDKKEFSHHLRKTIGLVSRHYLRSFLSWNPYQLQLSQFVILSHALLLLGKKFKSAEFLSGRMADLLSNLYLISALDWYQASQPRLSILTLLAKKRLYLENERLVKEIVDNYPYPLVRIFLSKAGIRTKLTDEEITRSVKEGMDKIVYLTSGISTNHNEYLRLMKEGLISNPETKKKISDLIIQVDTFKF